MSGPTLKINQPSRLEETFTSHEFKPWWGILHSYLDQDPANEQFLPGGRYETWTAASSSPRGIKGRVTALFVREEASSPEHHLSDTDFTAAQVKAVAIKDDPTIVGGQDAYARLDEEGKGVIVRQLKAARLAERNRLLDKMLAIIASFVHYTDIDDIRNGSTSMGWIKKYLEIRYNIETKGVNFLKIAQINFKAGMNPQTFYKQFRTGFIDNLRKAGDANNHLKPGDRLLADEVMTPTLEDTVVLWTLEKIDPRLPAKVAKAYEHRLDKDTHLIDLQATIFQSVPSLIESIDRDAGLNALASGAAPLGMEDIPVTANAFSAGSRGRGRGRPVAYRPPFSGRGSGRARGHPTISPLTGRTWTTKLCRICHEAQKSPAVVASHWTAECDSVSNSERRRMLASLQAMDLTSGNDFDDAEPDQEGDFDGQVQGEAAQGLQKDAS